MERDELILKGEKYISARRAAELVRYTSDYVGQLCRAGKVDAVMVGRGWYVDKKAIVAHKIASSNGKKDISNHYKLFTTGLEHG